jgi:hypothetical protein
MKVVIVLALVLVLAFATSGCLTTETKEQACVNSGGTVSTGLCCLQANDFPNLCLVGACGCSPDNSHEVKTCECGEGRCFDGNRCVPFVASFSECVNAGYTVMESLPRQCRTPDGRIFREDDETCVAVSGEGMGLFEAINIASGSECADEGTLEYTGTCNGETGTWWIDMEGDRPGCDPSCVVSVVEKTANINWRCTGALA